ncbi:acyltransferase 3 [Rhodopirellula europaea SH398]|uniref:Acyltransferase 3 n=1 Tax=Rhodopirellula europaea SH398 TaxID=1263868 RepID=M5RZW0_9BACT|nr:acyltransferase 3 [Rhodopirellula europaea SH398]
MIITHVELIKMFHGLPHAWNNPFLQNLGPAGVYFFFTLSGFLITRLLLYEKQVSDHISVWNFYVRRSLRIWPLYFFCVALGFFILPAFSLFDVPGQSNNLEENFATKLVLYLAFLPHVAGAIYDKVPNIGQLWSIGVEEFFYLFWPVIVLGFGTRMRRYVALLLLMLAGKVAFLIALRVSPEPSSAMMAWKEVLAASKFECMIIGGIFALPYIMRWKRLLSHPGVVTASLLLIPPTFLFYSTPFDDPAFLVFSLLFAIVMWNCSEKEPTAVISNRLFNYFGRISYGIYCYHFLVIALVVNATPRRWFDNIWLSTAFVYSSVTVLTILISIASFMWFEQPFNRMKGRFGYKEKARVE